MMRMEENTSGECHGFRTIFMENLRIRKQELEETFKCLLGTEKEYSGMLSADNFIELLDHAEMEISSHIKYSLLERKHEELEKIQHLMMRILKDEEFGLCEDCGRRIPEERLLIVPEATRCVCCQRKTEKLDSRKGLSQRSHVSMRDELLLMSEDAGASEKVELSFKLDIDHLLFMDLDIDSEDSDLDDHIET